MDHLGQRCRKGKPIPRLGILHFPGSDPWDNCYLSELTKEAVLGAGEWSLVLGLGDSRWVDGGLP